jgi:hypothetical protein
MAMAALGGLAIALLILCIPVGLMEMIVASSGLSEAWPAAAPPLGLKARLIMAGFAGLMTFGLIGLARRDAGLPAQDNGKGRAHRVQGAHKMGFAFSKLTALARGRAVPGLGPDTGPDAPILRRADAHPDAPSRPPIFASRDLDGIDIFPRGESGRRGLVARREPDAETAGQDSVVSDDHLPQPTFLRPAGPFAGPTLVEDEDDYDDEPVAQAEPSIVESPVAEPSSVDQPWTQPEAAPFAAPSAFAQPAEPLRPAPLPLPSTHGLSIAELTTRLERGLAHRSRTVAPSAAGRGVIADMPVAPAVPVRPAVEQDADEALRAALGALRSMAGRR